MEQTEDIASAPKERFDKLLRFIDLIKHKGFLSFLFISLSIILIFVTFIAVKNQTGYRSKASTDVITPESHVNTLQDLPRCTNSKNTDLSNGVRQEVGTSDVVPNPEQIQAKNTYTNLLWPQNSLGYDSFTWYLTIERDPSPDGYFWAHQFHFLNSEPGYFGLQTKGSNPTGKVAVFSIWNALESNGPEYYSTFGGEGVGYSARISYPWEVGKTYRLRIGHAINPPPGIWWSAWVRDESTQIEKYVGSIKVPETYGELNNNSSMWTERYSPFTSSCNDLKHSSVIFSNPSATKANLTINPCVSLISNQQDCEKNNNCVWVKSLYPDSNLKCRLKCNEINLRPNPKSDCDNRQEDCEWKNTQCINKQINPTITSSVIITQTPLIGNPCLKLDAGRDQCNGNDKCVWVEDFYENYKCRLKCEQLKKIEDCNKRIRDCKWENNTCANKTTSSITPVLETNPCLSLDESKTTCEANAKCIWKGTLYSGTNYENFRCFLRCNEINYRPNPQSDCSYRSKDCKWFENKCYPGCVYFNSLSACNSRPQGCKWVGTPTSGKCEDK